MPARAIKHIGNKTKSRIQSKRRNEVGRGKDRLLSAGVFENGRGNASVTKKSTLARGLSPRKEPVLNLRASATNRDIRKKEQKKKKKEEEIALSHLTGRCAKRPPCYSSARSLHGSQVSQDGAVHTRPSANSSFHFGRNVDRGPKCREASTRVRPYAGTGEPTCHEGRYKKKSTNKLARKRIRYQAGFTTTYMTSRPQGRRTLLPPVPTLQLCRLLRR